MQPEWINQSKTSYWQQGCDLGKSRVVYDVANTDRRWPLPGFAEGYWFGRTLPRPNGVPERMTGAEQQRNEGAK